MNKLISAEQAAKLIVDGDIVTVSSSSGLACPDHILAAIGKRYQQAAQPKDLTLLHPIALEICMELKGLNISPNQD